MTIKKYLGYGLGISTLLMGAVTTTHADNFKRFSVSAGWLHVMPQGKANPFNIQTAAPNTTLSLPVGDISAQALLNSLDPSAMFDPTISVKDVLTPVFSEMVDPDFIEVWQSMGYVTADGKIAANQTGDVVVNGLDQWRNQGTGLEAEDVDTLGLTFNYYINDNVSLQLIGGIPPKVDIKGIGAITAPMMGTATLPTDSILQLVGISELILQQDIPITDLGARKKASTARAWTPALEVQYQFGQSGVNKFRPYVGVGLMYAYFNDIKLDKGIESDLIAAGHMIQNLLDGNPGASLDGVVTDNTMKVDVDTDTAIAPIVTAGFTYDITPNWYGVASVSYAKLNNQATINVINETTGEQMIHSTTKIDIDPLITYLGVGYRF